MKLTLSQEIKSQSNMIKNNVQIEAWAPFGEGRNNMFDNPILKTIGGEYNKSVAQVILRLITQRGVIALAKSTRIERMQENFNIFDFKLSEKDMDIIKNLDTENSLYNYYCYNIIFLKKLKRLLGELSITYFPKSFLYFI